MNNPRSQGQGPQKKEEPSDSNMKGVKSAIDALTNEIKAHRKERNESVVEEEKWPKRTAVAAITYTAITLVILIATGYQTYLLRSNNIVSQRAFVFPASVQVTPAIDPAANTIKFVNFTYSVTNSGNTPTKELAFFFKCAPSAEDLQEPWSVLYQGPGQFQRASVFIGPHATITIVCNFPYEQFEQITAGKLFGFLMIDINYKDYLDDTVVHRTQAALKISQASVTTVNMANLPQQFRIFDQFPPSATIQVSLINVGRHNCTDDECQK
jgi:hypothetical protein